MAVPADPSSVPAAEYRTVRGDTLWKLAQSNYGNPSCWTALASANGITDPRRLGIGVRITIPADPRPGCGRHRAPDAGTRAAAVVATARTWLGVRYAWGGTSRAGVDCSGLVQLVYAAHGVKLPRTTYDQIKRGRAVSRSAIQPGDLVFPHSGHVQIYVGSGQVIEAPRPGLRVRISSLPSSILSIRRVL